MYNSNKESSNYIRTWIVVIGVLVGSIATGYAQDAIDERLDSYIDDIESGVESRGLEGISGLSALLQPEIEELRGPQRNPGIDQSLEGILPSVVEAVSHEDSRGIALNALGSIAQLIGPEHAKAYKSIEDHLFMAMTNRSYEVRHRDTAGLALEGLSELHETTVTDIANSARSEPNPSKSLFSLLAKNCNRYEVARKALLKLSKDTDSRKRMLVARELVLTREPGDALIEQLANLAQSDSDDSVRFSAIWTLRSGYTLSPELSSRLVTTLAKVIPNTAEPLQNRQAAIGTLSRLVQTEPKYLSVLAEICQDESIASSLRGDAIAMLPWASRYSSEVRPIIEAIAQDEDKIIRGAGERGLKIMDRDSRYTRETPLPGMRRAFEPR